MPTAAGRSSPCKTENIVPDSRRAGLLVRLVCALRDHPITETELVRKERWWLIWRRRCLCGARHGLVRGKRIQQRR
jgi:hypothetical protein